MALTLATVIALALTAAFALALALALALACVFVVVYLKRADELTLIAARGRLTTTDVWAFWDLLDGPQGSTLELGVFAC